MTFAHLMTTILVVNTDLGTCACCDTECSTATLAPLATDHTYACAVRDYSFERDDVLCQGCRDAFEANYGREANDVYSIFDRGIDKND